MPTNKWMYFFSVIRAYFTRIFYFQIIGTHLKKLQRIIEFNTERVFVDFLTLMKFDEHNNNF